MLGGGGGGGGEVPDMMFFNFLIMSNPRKSWPIRNHALIISR